MEDYLNGIDDDLYRSIEKGPYRVDRLQVVGMDGADEDMIAQGNKKKVNDKRCIRELRVQLHSRLQDGIRNLEHTQGKILRKWEE